MKILSPLLILMLFQTYYDFISFLEHKCSALMLLFLQTV